MPLSDLRVIELATVIAGPGCGRYLADFGADVIKVEHPDGGDGTRRLGWRDPNDGVTFWWKLIGRNKRSIVLDLKSPQGRADLLALVETADVLIENFRPGKLEALGLGPDILHEHNAELVVTRVSGFGQSGPYASRPGFATIAEAMSGFAAVNGPDNGGPTLPPIALTDEITALVAAFATMVALHSGQGQVVDVSLLESMAQVMGPLVSLFVATGERQQRNGSQLPYTAPRNTYRTRDGRWVAVSTSTDSVYHRVLDLVGLADGRFRGDGRLEHRDEVDRAVSIWIAARDADDVVAAFAEAEAACAPVFDVADVVADPHYRSRDALPELGGVVMQGLVAKLSATPGRLQSAAPELGADTEAVLDEVRRPRR